MQGKDEIILVGTYKDMKFGTRFNLTGADQKDVARALASISEAIEPYAFKFSEIDMAKIDSLAKPSGKGIGAVYGFLESNRPKELKEALAKSMPDPKLMDVGETYLLNTIMKKSGVKFSISKAGLTIEQETEKPDDTVAFIGKFGQWISIKKLCVDKVQDYEVSGILAGIDNTVVNKAFDFFGTKKDDAMVQSIAAGKRRTLGNLAEALRGLEPKLSGNDDDVYAVCKVCETIGYKPYASPEMLTDAHPDIKPPKTRGRKPKA